MFAAVEDVRMSVQLRSFSHAIRRWNKRFNDVVEYLLSLS